MCSFAGVSSHRVCVPRFVSRGHFHMSGSWMIGSDISRVAKEVVHIRKQGELSWPSDLVQKESGTDDADYPCQGHLWRRFSFVRVEKVYQKQFFLTETKHQHIKCPPRQHPYLKYRTESSCRIAHTFLPYDI